MTRRPPPRLLRRSGFDRGMYPDLPTPDELEAAAAMRRARPYVISLAVCLIGLLYGVVYWGEEQNQRRLFQRELRYRITRVYVDSTSRPLRLADLLFVAENRQWVVLDDSLFRQLRVNDSLTKPVRSRQYYLIQHRAGQRLVYPLAPLLR